MSKTNSSVFPTSSHRHGSGVSQSKANPTMAYWKVKQAIERCLGLRWPTVSAPKYSSAKLSRTSLTELGLDFKMTDSAEVAKDVKTATNVSSQVSHL